MLFREKDTGSLFEWDSKPKLSTFWQDLRLAWSFHPFFLPFLFPGACLLLLALVQANLLFGSTVAGQRIIDSLNSHHGGASPTAAMSTRILGFTLTTDSPFALAVLMAVLLLLAAVLGIGAEQLRIGLSQKFRLKMQRELLQALTVESGEMRSQRQTGEMIKTFMTDAAGVSALLIFGILGVFENAAKGVTYALGLFGIPDGWKILFVIVPLTVAFQMIVNRFFSSAERHANERSDILNRKASARIVRFFELVGRLVYFGGDQKESTELLQLAAQAGKANRKFSLISSSRAATAGIVTSLSLPLIVLNGDLIPGDGKIFIEEVDITGWHLIWKRELIGYLPTGFEFLDGTLEDNILLGRDRSKIEHFEESLRLSGVAAFMEEDGITLHHSIRSLSGEGYLSFGQRRRVGIAQLLCGKQRVLILDEPGSSLDPETMLALAGNLREAVRGRTTLLITHDPDVFLTDFNLFIKNGVIADIGPHDVLMLRNQDYFDLLNKNMKERRERVRTTPARLS